MPRRFAYSPFASLALAALACGSSHAPQPAANPPVPAVYAMHAQPHMLKPGQEDARCSFFQVPAGTPAVRAFRPANSPGVHHVLLFFAPKSAVESERQCWDFGDNWLMVAATGIGTPETRMPGGVAMPLDPDGVYVMQTHMINATHDTMTVTSGYDLELVADKATFQRAGLYLTGTAEIDIPARTGEYAVEGTCQGDLPAGAHLFHLFPHMHGLGTRFQVERSTGGKTTAIYDRTWTFTDQGVFPLMPEITLAAGEQLTTRCHYANPSDHDVKFGLTAADEMCFGVLYYYPAAETELDCVK
jgi:hypothetical protein